MMENCKNCATEVTKLLKSNLSPFALLLRSEFLTNEEFAKQIIQC